MQLKIIMVSSIKPKHHNNVISHGNLYIVHSSLSCEVEFPVLGVLVGLLLSKLLLFDDTGGKLATSELPPSAGSDGSFCNSANPLLGREQSGFLQRLFICC